MRQLCSKSYNHRTEEYECNMEEKERFLQNEEGENEEIMQPLAGIQDYWAVSATCCAGFIYNHGKRIQAICFPSSLSSNIYTKAIQLQKIEVNY